MRRLLHMLTLVAGAIFFAACGQTEGPTDTPTSGTIDIAVDETYKPVIEEQLHVFDSANPNAHIRVHYKSEADCIKDYLEGKVRLVLITRLLSETEKKYAESKGVYPDWDILARDAVAVVVHPENPQNAFGISQLRDILTGASSDSYNVVFDNAGSSTLRFIQDSILKSQRLGSNVFAANGNDSVVNYVARNPKSIGIVGLNWVSSDDDPNNTGAFITKIKVAALYNDSTREYYQPYQAYVANRSYPLARNLYFLKNETHQGLGTGFANFLRRDRGQLIFAHAHLFPLKLSVVLRPAELRREMPE